LERELEEEDEEEPERVFVAADDFDESDASDMEVCEFKVSYFSKLVTYDFLHETNP